MEETYSFSEALIMLKDGRKVVRRGWIHGTYLFYMDGIVVNKDNDQYGILRLYDEDEVFVQSSIFIMHHDFGVGVWSVKQSDILANDWQIA